MMSPVDYYYGPLPGRALFWALSLVALVLFLLRAVKLWRPLTLGRSAKRLDQPGRRLKLMLAEVLLQGCNFRRVSRRDLAGLGHALIFWGFCLFLVDYVLEIFLAGGLGAGDSVERAAFFPLFRRVLDFFGVVVIGALLWAAWRRYVVRPTRLARGFEAGLILAAVLFLVAANLALDRLASQHQSVAYVALWWLHYIAVLAFGVYLLYSKHMHVLAAPFNLFFRPLRRVGELVPTNLLDPLPTSEVGFLHWKELLDLYSCAQCGRCQDACPATRGETALKPMSMMANLKQYLIAHGNHLASSKRQAANANGFDPVLVGNVVTEAEVWACTTCGRCQEECPEVVEHVDRIVSLRRSLVESGRVPATARACLESLALLGSPGEQPPLERTNWLASLPDPMVRGEAVDVLYWVGCMGTFEPKGQEITRAMIDLFNAAGVRYSMLGEQERCCGDPARRLGEEGLFQRLAEDNLAVLRRHRFHRIVTHCPHCYNVLANEYTEIGGDHFVVQHHSQFLSELVQSGGLSLRPFGQKVTFHDPCYLGRYNGLYEAPRAALRAVPQLAISEMADNRDRANCCGGGGGQFWLEWSGRRRINYARFADAEILAPDVIVTACPSCKVMLDDACNYRGKGGEVKVRDIAEVLQAALAGNTAGSGVARR